MLQLRQKWVIQEFSVSKMAPKSTKFYVYVMQLTGMKLSTIIVTGLVTYRCTEQLYFHRRDNDFVRKMFHTPPRVYVNSMISCISSTDVYATWSWDGGRSWF